jgi:F-type H+-transporting ATPase subunit b
MYALSLLAMAESAGTVGRIADTFGVDWPHLFAQIVSFCILCFVLQRYAYKPVLEMLDQRRQRIAQELADSERIKAELARTEAQRQEVLLEANAQAAKLIEEARAAAARVGQLETQKAIAAAEQIIVKAREAAAQEQARMFAELKQDVGRLVLETASRVTGKILTAEDQRRLAEETARQLAPAA